MFDTEVKLSNRNTPTKTSTNIDKEILIVKSSKVFSEEEKDHLFNIVGHENANQKIVEKVSKILEKEFKNGQLSSAFLRSLFELSDTYELGMEQLIPLVIMIKTEPI